VGKLKMMVTEDIQLFIHHPYDVPFAFGNFWNFNVIFEILLDFLSQKTKEYFLKIKKKNLKNLTNFLN
jgi:hypothetical protein